MVTVLELASVLFTRHDPWLALADAWTNGDEKLTLAVAFIAWDFSDALAFLSAVESSVARSLPLGIKRSKEGT